MQNRGVLIPFAVGGALVAMASMSLAGQTTPKPSADVTFATKAAQAGAAEVLAGQLAQDQGGSQAVKDFGEKMVKDHTAANDKLKAIAVNKGITLPTEPDAQDKAVYARLQKLHGAAFDSLYLKSQRQGHAQAASLFQKEANSGHDADLKAFASDTLPTIKEHQKMLAGLGSSKTKPGKM